MLESGVFHCVLCPSNFPCMAQTVRLGMTSCVYISPNFVSQHYKYDMKIHTILNKSSQSEYFKIDLNPNDNYIIDIK